MTPTHHPGEEMLVDYATGSLTEAASMVVATHLALCPDCRARVRTLEAVGGILLEKTEPAPVSDAMLRSLLARLDEPAPTEPAPVPARPLSARPLSARRCGACPLLPQPLRGYVGMDVDRVPWRTLIPGLEEVEIKVGTGAARTRLFRIRAGTAVPRHTHRGIEMTMVLDGGFTDQRGHFRRGDLAVSGHEVDHSPLADPDGCICVAVTDAPLRLTGRLGRLLNPFVRL